MAKQRIPVFRKDQKLKFLDPQRQIEVESSNFAMDWWREEGVYIDPDTEDVDWHDKRGELAQMAYIAGYKKAKGSA